MTHATAVLKALEQQHERTNSGEGAIAQVLIGLGDYDEAFQWLRLAVDHHNGFTLKVAAVWDPLRSDRRLADLLEAAGLAAP